jgi:hypothetical protein
VYFVSFVFLAILGTPCARLVGYYNSFFGFKKKEKELTASILIYVDEFFSHSYPGNSTM